MSIVISVDTETGGLNPHKHSLLTVGLVPIINGVISEDHKMLFKVKSDLYHVTPDAMRINQLDLVDLHDNGHTISDIGEAMKDWTLLMKSLGGPEIDLLGHNLDFDLSFLRVNRLLQSLGKVRMRFDTKWLASEARQAHLIQPESGTLEHLCQYYGLIPDGERQQHRADDDALLTARLHYKLQRTIFAQHLTAGGLDG